LPLTTTKVDTIKPVLGLERLKVRVPVGSNPPEITAVSLRLRVDSGKTELGFGVVDSVGVAAETVTDSEGLLFSAAGLLLLSPEYEALHWYVPVLSGTKPVGVV
jgi:hypothetical protein